MNGGNKSEGGCSAVQPTAELCGCGSPVRYMTKSGGACNKYARCLPYAEQGEAREAKNAQCAALTELLKEARKIIRASSSRQLAKDWDRRATQALRDEGRAYLETHASHGQAPAQAAPQQEVVAWMRDWDVYDPSNSGPEFSHTKKKKSEGWVPLYTVPQPLPASQDEAPDVLDVPDQCPYFGPSPHRDVWLAGWYAARAALVSQQPAPSAVAHKACKPDMLVNGGALKLALNVLRRAGKHEVADELEATTQPAPTPQADSVTAPAATCPTCKAPCTTTVHMRGGEYGWGTTDLERTVYHYAPAQAADRKQGENHD